MFFAKEKFLSSIKSILLTLARFSTSFVFDAIIPDKVAIKMNVVDSRDAYEKKTVLQISDFVGY